MRRGPIFFVSVAHHNINRAIWHRPLQHMGRSEDQTARSSLGRASSAGVVQLTSLASAASCVTSASRKLVAR
jgi:hypothetical protein